MPMAFQVQTDLIESYRDDFAKYRPQVDPACLDPVSLNAARSVGEQIKYTRLNDGHTGQTNRGAFDLLAKAKVLHKIPSCDPSGLPFGTYPNCPRGLVLYDGTYQALPEQRLEFLPLYSVSSLCAVRG